MYITGDCLKVFFFYTKLDGTQPFLVFDIWFIFCSQGRLSGVSGIFPLPSVMCWKQGIWFWESRLILPLNHSMTAQVTQLPSIMVSTYGKLRVLKPFLKSDWRSIYSFTFIMYFEMKQVNESNRGLVSISSNYINRTYKRGWLALSKHN